MNAAGKAISSGRSLSFSKMCRAAFSTGQLKGMGKSSFAVSGVSTNPGLITDTGVPERFIDTDDWGGEVMLRLDDGWCAALDRNTMMCTIYEKRPLICREFEMGAPECIDERLGISTAYR